MNQLSVEEFNEMLHKWTGKNIKISKHELRDNDEMMMKLEDITYSTDTRRIDDYEAMHSLKLNGSGKIENEDNNFSPLPLSTYEIPLEDSTEYQYDGAQFALHTDRGAYTIELID